MRHKAVCCNWGGSNLRVGLRDQRESLRAIVTWIGELEPISAKLGDPLRALANLVDSLVGVPKQLQEFQQQMDDLRRAFTFAGPQRFRHVEDDSRSAR